MNTTAKELKNLFTTYENLSLRRVAEALELSYPMMLKASKKPITGVPYNPEDVNYEAIAEMLNKHEKTLEDIDWEEYNTARQRSSIVAKDVAQFHVGDKVYLRTNATTPYEIIYMTDTHIVIMLEGTSQPIAWSYNTFFFKGPSSQPRATKVEAPAEAAEAE